MNDLTELTKFAKRYAKAWCSQNSDSVAAFHAENGSLSVNDGPPAVGRAAIAEEARGFMTTFPDMVVTLDKLVRDEEGTKFHWTLTGTNTGPGGTGKRVRISGYELWKIEIVGRPHRLPFFGFGKRSGACPTTDLCSNTSPSCFRSSLPSR